MRMKSKDNIEVEPANSINVDITSSEIATMEEAVVVHVDDAGTAEVVDNKTVSDKVSFDADSFSIYAVVGTESISSLYNASNGNIYEVTVTYGPEAKIPFGSTLRVTEIGESTAPYNSARNAVLADIINRGETIDYSDFYLAALDISIIDRDGNEIEPESQVAAFKDYIKKITTLYEYE